MNNTYAEFLLQLIKQLYAEDKIKELRGRFCYLCNVLDYPMISNVIPSPSSWVEYNAEYIKMLHKSIKRLLIEEHKSRQKEYAAIDSRYVPTEPTTITSILERRYPDTTPLGSRVEWLQDLAKYHKARGTSRTFHETRNWLKLVK